MEYSNPEIPEGINTSKENPLKEFLILTTAVITGFATLILILVLLSDYIVGYIPFSWESQINLPVSSSEEHRASLPERGRMEAYLQSLADKISETQNLPAGMTIQVHYLDNDTINAFATLGGHVFFFRGLLEKFTSENALSMVMAHEIAHIKYRHPIQSLGRGVIFAVLMSTISSSLGDAIMQSFLNQAGYLTVLKFNRDMETASDEAAIRSLHQIYGHLNGADDLFKILLQEQAGKESYEFLHTHPLTSKRLKHIQTSDVRNKIATNPELTPLPDGFKKWLANTKE